MQLMDSDRSEPSLTLLRLSWRKGRRS